MIVFVAYMYLSSTISLFFTCAAESNCGFKVRFLFESFKQIKSDLDFHSNSDLTYILFIILYLIQIMYEFMRIPVMFLVGIWIHIRNLILILLLNLIYVSRF